LGVVGNFGSDVTLAAGKVYQEGQLVQISPTSTSVKLSGFGNYVFRTVPSDRFAANALTRYMLTKLKKKRLLSFLIPKVATANPSKMNSLLRFTGMADR
jgi:branched-chain amino acid transport system substrate-binding protein